MVVCFSGHMRAGKDTCAAGLQSLYGGTTLSLAKEVKAVGERVWGHLERDRGREVWQHIGQSMREYDSFAWLKAWRRGLSRIGSLAVFESRTDHIFVPDVRYENELHFFQALGGVVIRLEVTPEQQAERGAQMNAVAHISETQLDGCAWFDLIVPAGCSPSRTFALVQSFLTTEHDFRPGEDGDLLTDPEAAASLLAFARHEA